MKKILITSAIATPIVTLGLLIGISSLQEDYSEVRENIDIVNQKDTILPTNEPDIMHQDSLEVISETLEQEVTTTPVIEQESTPEPIKPDYFETGKYVHEKLTTALKTDLSKRHHLSIWNTLMSHYYGNPMLFSKDNIDKTIDTCANHFNSLKGYEDMSLSLYSRKCGL